MVLSFLYLMTRRFVGTLLAASKATTPRMSRSPSCATNSMCCAAKKPGRSRQAAERDWLPTQPARPHSWHAAECPADQGLRIAQELRSVAARHRFAFEVSEEATDFDMGRQAAVPPRS
jgi:hypothetical protein